MGISQYLYVKQNITMNHVTMFVQIQKYMKKEHQIS